MGFSGLAAVQTKGEAPVLELSDLHGDIIGIASISETESKLVPANETSEYGVPRTTISAKYSWLGADEVPTELPTGIIDMGARAYIPQLGRFEQTDPQPGGSTNAYAYTDDDPVNQADPSGENTIAYNYEATETGSAQAGLPEQYGAPDAIKPPPANVQVEAEFAAHPPWDAAAAFNEGEEEEGGGGATTAPTAKAAMINRGGTKGSCGCDIWVRGGKITLRNGRNVATGVIAVTAGTVGAALSGFAFAACVAGGGEFDVAIHCVLGPGVAFTASVTVIGYGLRELGL
jgi:RHS repeat-associated protein